MKAHKRTFAICTIVTVCCIIMAIVDAYIQPSYFIKSAVKAVFFLVCPLVYGLADKTANIREILKPNKSGIKTALMLCIPVYVVILGGYLLLKDVFDFSSITGALTDNIGVNKNNFVFVAIYISFVNSLLEEFFFRGFAFFTLGKHSGKKFAYIFSSGAFALYHIAMMTGWFSLLLYVLIIVGLFAGGIIFNLLNERSNNIYTSWFVHMFANFAINTVGFILFDII